MNVLKDPVISKLIGLGERYKQIRAMILFSSRTDPNASCDIFSDYDISIFTSDPDSFGESDEWFEGLGNVLVVYREEPSERYNGYTRLVQYEDGTKIDFGVCHIDVIVGFCNMDSLPDYYDHGYEVLLDEDGVTTMLKSPTYKAYIPKVPTDIEFLSLVNEFWWDSTYVAKYLWRDDLMAIKFMLDHQLKQYELRKMLEWSVSIKNNWNWKPGHYGRGIRKALDAEISFELTESYTGGDIEDLWESLFRTTALFRKVAIGIGDALGYEYPYDLDKRVSIYHQTIKNLDRQTTNHDVLVNALREGYKDQ